MGERKKVLLWGCIYSQWTTHFIDHFLLKNNYEVWVLKTSNDLKYVDFFKERNINLIECPKPVIDLYDGNLKKNRIRLLYIHFLQIKAALQAGHFDLINLHFVDSVDIVDTVVLKCIMKSKLILSYWGSDLFRMKEKMLLFLGIFVKHADYITFESGSLKIKFNETYKWAHKINSEIVMFGLSLLDIIKKKTELCEKNREKWGIPEDKIVIAVGYNGIPQQQHIEVLRSIAQLKCKIKKEIFILLQMSYGGTNEYRDLVLKMVEKTGVKYKMITHFLDDDDVAELRIMTDIFINAQSTDSFSGSVGENLYAGTKLINAKWLAYQEFKEHEFKYFEFENFSELGIVIEEALNQEIDVSRNRELMWNLRAWESCFSKWKNIYQKVLGDNEKSISDRC